MPRATRPLLIVTVVLMVSGIGVAVMRIADERGEVAVHDPAANAEEHAPVDPAGNGTDPGDPDGEPDTDELAGPDADEPDADEPDAHEPDAHEPDADELDELDADEPDADESVGRDADGDDAGADTATSGEVAAGLPGTGELPNTGPSGASAALGAAAVAIAATRRRRLA